MPLSFFWGEEDFLLEKEINKIKKEVLGQNVNELNFKIVDNPPLCDLLFFLKSRSLAGKILYVIKMDRYFLEGAKKIKLEDSEIDEIINSMDLIPDTTHIILTVEIARRDRKKPDSRKRLYKAIQKNTQIKEFAAFKPYEEYKIMPVLKTMLKDFNLKAKESVLSRIIALKGPYLRDLYSTLDNISLYVYPNNEITETALDNLYPSSNNIFLVTNLIFEKNYPKALFEISNMLQKSHYLEILAFLQTSFSKLLMTKIYSNLPTYEIAKKTSQSESAVKASLYKLKKVPLSELIRLKRNFLNVEYQIKTGEKEPITAIYEGFIK